MNRRYRAVAARAGHMCEYCRAPQEVFSFPLEVDHLIPRSKGGANGLENLALSCRSCNAFKCAHEVGPVRYGGAPLFNPRMHTWDEHFYLDLETSIIESISKIGYGTIERLRLNSPSQIMARSTWKKMGVL